MLQRVVVTPSQISHPTVLLNTEQQHYLSRVLRLKAGDRFIAMDGSGHAWITSLQEVQPDEFEAQILEPVNAQTELSVSITLVIALPKGNGFDDVVRQATELGVGCIAPIISDRTLLNPSTHKLERWRRIAQEAAEQSERQWVPTILDPISFSQYVEQSKAEKTTQTYFCVTRYPAPHFLELLRTSSGLQSVSVVIGPEGGWTETEVSQAIAANYQPVSLGTRILRAVTAPIVALSLMAATYETGTVEEK